MIQCKPGFEVINFGGSYFGCYIDLGNHFSTTRSGKGTNTDLDFYLRKTLITMREIPEELYVKNFQYMLDWFKQRRPSNWKVYNFPIPETYWRMLILQTDVGNPYRIIFKGTIKERHVLPEIYCSYKDVEWLERTPCGKFHYNPFEYTLQVCFIHLNNIYRPEAETMYIYHSKNIFKQMA